MSKFFYFIFFLIIAFFTGILFVFFINDSVVFIPKFFLHHVVKIADSTEDDYSYKKGMLMWQDCRLKSCFNKRTESVCKNDDLESVQFFITVFLQEWADFVLQSTDNHYIITIHNVSINPAGVFFIDCSIDGNKKDQESAYGQWIIIENIFNSLKTVFPGIQEIYLFKKDALYPFDKIISYASRNIFLDIKNNTQEEKKTMCIPLLYTFKGNALFDQYERSLYGDVIAENEEKCNMVLLQKPFTDPEYCKQFSFLSRKHVAAFISCYQAKKSYCTVLVPDMLFSEEEFFLPANIGFKQNELGDSGKLYYFQKIKNYCMENNVSFCIKKINHLLFNAFACDSIIIEYGGIDKADIKKFLSMLIAL